MGRPRITVPCAMLLVALAMGVFHSSAPVRLTTADMNGDGRPDVWRYSDPSGRLIRIVRDTNFDGRSDVEESYANGRLTKRESDRNFDDRVDLREDFSATTGAHVRSVVDADFDGIADLLVLFDNGRPVHSRWAERAPEGPQLAVPILESPGRDSSNSLRALDDPFASNLRVQADDERTDNVTVVGILSSARPMWAAWRATPHKRSGLVHVATSSFVWASISPTALRGPPSFHTFL